MALVLASKSPRRRQLMTLVCPVFETDEAHFEEDALPGEAPAQTALRLARGKAQNVAARRPRDVVIGCDTVVEAAGRLLGKPANREQAADMLLLLSGRRHWVHTGVCIIAPGRAPAAFTNSTAVDFAPLPKAEIDAYTATPEAYDKAGGYGIQGWAARYVLGVDGCFYNVMGLPVAALYHKLLDMGVYER